MTKNCDDNYTCATTVCDFVEQSLVMQSVLKSCFESPITARTLRLLCLPSPCRMSGSPQRRTIVNAHSHKGTINPQNYVDQTKHGTEESKTALITMNYLVQKFISDEVTDHHIIFNFYMYE